MQRLISDRNRCLNWNSTLTGSYGATIALAECVRRAGHRLDSPRVPGPCNCDQREPSAPRPVLVRRLLSPLSDPSVARQRLPGCSPHPTAEQRQGDRDSASRRASPSLRTPRRLIRFRGLRNLPRSPLCGGPSHRVLNPHGEHLLARLASAIGDSRRPTQLVHFYHTVLAAAHESHTRWSFEQAQIMSPPRVINDGASRISTVWKVLRRKCSRLYRKSTTP